MTELIYSSTANIDLDTIFTYIAGHDLPAALNWMEKVHARCNAIAFDPLIGDLQPRLGPGVRGTAVGRYVIFHRKTQNRVEILRIIAGDQDIQHL